MYQRPENDYSRVNNTGKNMRKSNFDHLNPNSYAVSKLLQPQSQTQVYIIDKNDFKSLVQQLTRCERLPQNLTKHQKIVPEPIKRISSIPPSAMAAQEDPDVLLYMRYLQSLLEESSGSNGDQFQGPVDKYESHMVVQAHSQPQAPTQSMPQSNGFGPNTFSSSWFNDSPQDMHGTSPLPSTHAFSSIPQPGGFGPDLDSVRLDELFEVPYEIN